MTEQNKPKPTPIKVRPGYEHWGEMQPVKYPDTFMRRLGNKLLSWLTPWNR